MKWMITSAQPGIVIVKVSNAMFFCHEVEGVTGSPLPDVAVVAV